MTTRGGSWTSGERERAEEKREPEVELKYSIWILISGRSGSTFFRFTMPKLFSPLFFFSFHFRLSNGFAENLFRFSLANGSADFFNLRGSLTGRDRLGTLQVVRDCRVTENRWELGVRLVVVVLASIGSRLFLLEEPSYPKFLIILLYFYLFIF